MSKKDILDRIWQSHQGTEGVSKAALKTIVDEVFNQVQNITNEEGQCRIVGFGSFKKVHREERIASHPQTREKITVPACNTVRYTPGSEFKDIVQDK